MAAGIYLHIPFCKSRCSYCDFATDVYRNNDVVERYVAALCREVGPPAYAGGSDLVDTVYFGGGTPSLLKPEQLDRILAAVNEKFQITSDAEITMEMNPATVTPTSLEAFRHLGVNRASFGVQTFEDRALKLLARGHDSNDARSTFKMLRETGFDNVSFDLIAGLPGQSLETWERNLDEALQMGPEHLSLYLLEIHQGTPLAAQIRGGRQPIPDAELAAAMYELMLDKMSAAGYEQYEISNFSRPGFESRHNTKYWRLDPVFGFGVSAHSFDGTHRYSNERDTGKYVDSIEKTASAEVFRENIDASSEFVFLGLRLEMGIDLDRYRRQYDIELTERYGKGLAEMAAFGLIEIANGRLRLTRRGKLFSNEVFAVFV